jgi:radical SAM protein with 4Fe4S-binding SPASM domain
MDGSLELTHRCNLRCVHCYLGSQNEIRRSRKGEMTIEEIKSVVDQLVDAGTLALTLSGGDPMVRKDFPEIYEYVVKQGLLVTVFCDGVLITDRIVELFKRYPPRKVEVTLYGATASTYERATQVRGSFKRCLRGIDKLEKNGIRYVLKTVLLKINQHELAAMRAVAKRRGVNFYFDTAVFPCLPHNDNGGQSNLPRINASTSVEVAPPSFDSRKQAAADLSGPLSLRVDPHDGAAAQTSDDENIKDLAELYLRTKNVEPSEYLYVCGAGLTTFHVDPYGGLQPCTISRNVDYSLRDGSFLDGWNGPVAEIRKIPAPKDSSCGSCDKQSICGGCPAFSFAEHGAADIKSDYTCQTTHAIFEGIRDTVEAMLEVEQ